MTVNSSIKFLLFHRKLGLISNVFSVQVERHIGTMSNSTTSQQQRIPQIRLNNGQFMPQIGFGTSVQKENETGQLVADGNAERITTPVIEAIQIGYRHFDCAASYLNEPGIGAALSTCIQKGLVKREELFIVSKVWNTNHRRERVQQSVAETLKKLQLEYLDLVYIHWPCSFKEGENNFPRDKNGNLIEGDPAHDFVETYKALEELVSAGKVKSIGLSNFDRDQVQRILDNCSIKPVALQNEVHVYLQQKQFEEFCRQNDIALVAYAPLASGHRAEQNVPRVDENRVLLDIAQSLSSSAAATTTPVSAQQVALAFLLQRGIVVIPRALGKAHMLSNLKAAELPKLSDEQMATITGLNKNLSTFPVDGAHRASWKHLKNFPKEALQ